jgi:hypothetical protein
MAKIYVRDYYSEIVNGQFVEKSNATQIVTVEYELNGIVLMRTHMTAFSSNADTKKIENIQKTELYVGGVKTDGVWGGGVWQLQVNSNDDPRTYRPAVATTEKYVDLDAFATTGVPVVVGANIALVQPEYNEDNTEVINQELVGTVKVDEQGNPLYINEVDFYALNVMPSLKDMFKFSIFRTQEITLS